MKAIIDSSYLLRELKSISPVIRKNSVLPITGAVKMEFTKGSVKVTGTDLETTAIFHLKCESKNVFDLVISYKDITDVCSKMYNVPISIELKENKIVISDLYSVLSFSKAGEIEEFPTTTDEELDLTVDVDCDLFYALSNSNTCKHKDELKVNMNMPCLDFKNKKGVNVVGTDGNVLFLKEFNYIPNKDRRVMVPETFVQLVKTFQYSTIWASDKWIKAECGDRIILGRLGEQKFANYEYILPKDEKYNLKANVSDFKKALDIVGVSSDAATGLCVLNFKDGELLITSSDIDFGKEAETKLSVTHEVDFDFIAINGKKMTHLLNLIDSTEVEMAFFSPSKSIYIKPVGDKSITCLLQPLYYNN